MILISIHIFPHEIKRFQRIVETFKESVGYLENVDQIMLLVTLNNNSTLIDWGGEDQKTITDMFSQICKTSPLETKWEVQTDKDFLGVNEHRRNTIALATSLDTIIFLDSDLHFDERLLAHQVNAIDLVRGINTHYIITPQIIKLWDSTWDCIVNDNYINKSFNYHKTINPHEVSISNYGPVALKNLDTFKWGGGWFNAISASLLKYIGIPKSFTGYGPDDTFIMECCKIMKKHKKDVQQYILSNMVVAEDRTPIECPIKLKKTIPDFREECNKHFLSELSHFRGKL